MKTLTIIPEDNMVIVDGDGLKVDVNVDSDIHAIHWDDNKKKGLIEFRSDKDNKIIGSGEVAPFLQYATSYENEKARILNVMAKEEAAILEHEALPTTRRSKDYIKEIPMGDQLDAILKYIDKQDDKDAEIQAIIDKSKEIKQRIPLNGE